MPGFNSQSRGTVRTLKLVVIVLCYHLYSCAVVIVLLLFVFVVLRIEIVRTTTLPPGVNPLAVVKYIYVYIQGVPGGKDLTSGECSLGQTIPI